MGRRREFDLDQAVGIATDLFWRRGYEGTSVGDLTDAMGITAPSFYFAFGSKEALFRRILETYQASQADLVEAAFGQADARAVVEALMDGFADLLTSPGRAPGCLIMNSALPVVDGHPFRGEWAAERHALRSRLQQRFSREQRAGGHLPAGHDPAGLAQMVVALIWGFAIEAQSGASRKELHRAVAQALRMWPQGPAGEVTTPARF